MADHCGSDLLYDHFGIQVRFESTEDEEVLDSNPLGIYIMDHALTGVSTP